MKKRIKLIIILVIVIAVITSLAFIRYKKPKEAFTLKWHEITPQSQEALSPTFGQLQSVFIDAFVPLIKPYVYATDPKLVNIPAEKKSFVDQKVIAGITESLKTDWQRKINQLYGDLKNDQISAYLAVAKNNQQQIVGFALFSERNIKKYLTAGLLTVLEGSSEQIPSNDSVHDEVFVDLLAVQPEIQKKGIGKVVLFSVFEYHPLIKKIYLRTSASIFNNNAQAFYEHIGFTQVLKGIFAEHENRAGFDHEEIVYVYQKK
jgi:ribosomal protein S18 acetylase RimI-like enzyme